MKSMSYPTTKTEAALKTGEIRVALLEDHLRLRGVLEKLLKFSPGLCCCGAYKSGQEMLDDFSINLPDVASLDLSVSDINGLEALGVIKKEWPSVRCILFSGHTESDYAERALSLGAYGYIVKGDAQEFLKGIRAAAAGQIYVSPRYSHLLT